MTRPNLLVIMVDQMQAAMLDEDAPVALPNLRRLAERSSRFTHAFTPAPICTPARASFQLGLPVHAHGVTGNDRPMPEGAATLADRLHDAGYATSYLGKWHLDKGRPRGWRRWATHDQLKDPQADMGVGVMDGVEAPHHGVADYGIERHIDGRIAYAGREELARLGRGENPFALMVSFFGPHAPYYLPRPWHDRFDPDALPLPATFDAPFEHKPRIQETFRCRAWGLKWDEAKWRRVRAAYFGYLAMLDHLIGELLEGVGLDDTAVVFLSDHGENNGHLRMTYKGPMMYDTLVRIPALLCLPGGQGARLDDRLVDLTDFTATLLSLAGASTAAVAGHDLTDRGWPGRDAVVSEFHEANWVRPVCRQRLAMWRDKRHKYVYYENDRDELYDLNDRPPEVVNRIDDPAGQTLVRRMRAALAAEVPWVGSSMAGWTGERGSLA